MKDQDLDKLLRDHFDNLDIQPSTDVWKKIVLELDEQKIVPIKKKTSWLKAIVAAAAILICVGIASFLLQHQSGNNAENIRYAERKIDNEIITPQKVTPKVAPVIIEKQVQFSGKSVNNANPHENKSVQPIASYTEVIPSEKQQAFQRLKVDKEQPIMVVVDTQTQAARVVEYIPIKPLVENPEEENSMMASTNANSQTVVTKVLNILSKTINQGNGPEVQFSNDDEGSLQIDLLNSLVKNKKRKK
ncbi:hypothetical protein [Sphingobacterium faecium]|uniref:hypothetical protein n=1 Tax=Sphingobacterium faecium TaxID=34087 RepID=UPI00246930A7|nr:hypothetical protein [Sphingobacterium faecium]MDH5828352.1 hypothetical protein [Sphingobacterium faecium]